MATHEETHRLHQRLAAAYKDSTPMKEGPRKQQRSATERERLRAGIKPTQRMAVGYACNEGGD